MTDRLAIEAVREFSYSLDGVTTKTAKVGEVVTMRAGAAASLVDEGYAKLATTLSLAPQDDGEGGADTTEGSRVKEPDVMRLLVENMELRTEIQSLRGQLAALPAAPTTTGAVDAAVNNDPVGGSGDSIGGATDDGLGDSIGGVAASDFGAAQNTPAGVSEDIHADPAAVAVASGAGRSRRAGR